MLNGKMIFLSHANPEDNGFTQWLALRLAKDGYPVWCDLAKLLGGEDFWSDAEVAIREQTAKFIFVLSRTSNHKQGVLQELSVAAAVGKKVERFILPVKIDDLSYDEVNIELKRLTAINFTANWVSGYSQLITRLKEDAVSKQSGFSPDAVSLWWQNHFSSNDGVAPVPEDYVSNEFLIDQMPSSVHLIYLDNPDSLKKTLPETPFPIHPYRSFLVSFAPREDISAALSSAGLTIRDTDTISFDAFMDHGVESLHIDRRTAQNMSTHLLRSAVEIYLAGRQLKPYALSNRRMCYWFPQNIVKDDRVSFVTPSGKKQWRNLVGYKSLSVKPGEAPQVRNWHYAVEVRVHLHPRTVMTFLPHVIFSQEGAPYDSSRKQHSARRSQCKDWWNNDWLDRMIALLSHISDGQACLSIPVSHTSAFTVSTAPCNYESPISFSKKDVADGDADLAIFDDSVNSDDDDEEQLDPA